jgi:Bacterial aa3 type cytochrome c oxidase subunit IV
MSMAGQQAQEGGHPDMDYAEHERTYEGFLRFSVIGTIWVIAVVVGLAIGATGKSWGWGGFMIFVSTLAAFAGALSKTVNHYAVSVALGLSLLIWASKAIH